MMVSRYYFVIGNIPSYYGTFAYAPASGLITSLFLCMMILSQFIITTDTLNLRKTDPA